MTPRLAAQGRCTSPQDKPLHPLQPQVSRTPAGNCPAHAPFLPELATVLSVTPTHFYGYRKVLPFSIGAQQASHDSLEYSARFAYKGAGSMNWRTP